MTRPYDEWIGFFQYLSAIAATLLGLAFLTFQVRAEIWRGHPLRQTVAVTTLAELAAPMFFGLIFLFPDHPWTEAGFVVGLGGYGVIMWHLVEFIRRYNEADSFDKKQMLGSTIVLATFSCVMWIPSLPWKAGFLVWMIFSGLSEAWIFLRAPQPADQAQVTAPVDILSTAGEPADEAEIPDRGLEAS